MFAQPPQKENQGHENITQSLETTKTVLFCFGPAFLSVNHKLQCFFLLGDVFFSRFGPEKGRLLLEKCSSWKAMKHNDAMSWANKVAKRDPKESPQKQTTPTK